MYQKLILNTQQKEAACTSVKSFGSRVGSGAGEHGVVATLCRRFPEKSPH